MESRNYVKKNEWMAYAVGALGQGMVYGIMSSYISDFYLNVLKVTRQPETRQNANIFAFHADTGCDTHIFSFLRTGFINNTKNDIRRCYLCCVGYDLHFVGCSVLEPAKRNDAECRRARLDYIKGKNI